MKKRMKASVSTVLWLAMTTLMLILGSAVVCSADSVITLNLSVKYGQTEARSMLTNVNDLRTGRYVDGGQTKPWCRAADGSIDTASYANLSELTYDYDLEKIAMQRAVEIAYSFSHTRPDGSRSFTAYSGYSYNAQGENIAAGQSTVKAAFEDWCETNDSYDDQGHRQNMMSSGFTRIGIAHVAAKYASGITRHFWVQEFGRTSSTAGLTSTTANDSEGYYPIEAAVSTLKVVKLTASSTSLTAEYGSDSSLPTVSTAVQSTGAWPATPILAKYDVTWSSANTNIAGISGGNIVPKSVGSTTITATPALGTSMDAESAVNFTLTVNPKPITSATVSLSKSSFTYTGSAQTPTATVTLGGKTLVSGTDYTMAITGNVNAGTATMTFTGKGNYTGTVTKTFTIAKASLSSCTTNALGSKVYDREAYTPNMVVTFNGKTLTSTDYSVTYENNVNAGTGRAVATGKGNFTGTLESSFTIDRADLANTTISNIAAVTYTGSAIKPATSITYAAKALVEGTDYTVAFAGNTNAGTAAVTYTGKGNFTGTASASFTINKQTITAAMVKDLPAVTYKGSAFTPALTINDGNRTLTAQTDYTVRYENNINIGTATVGVTGTGNYQGSVTKTFAINPIDLSKASISVVDTMYTGQAMQPTVVVSYNGEDLQAGVAYELTYSNNINAGTAYATVTGIKNYKGSLTGTFIIERAPIKNGTLSVISDVTYNAAEQTPAVTVNVDGKKLTNKTDYTVTYGNNINAGNATVTVTGTGNYQGQLSSGFVIHKMSLSDMAMPMIPAQEYTRNAIEPSIQLTLNGKSLAEGRDFAVAFAGNRDVGTADVTLTGMDNFTGTENLHFEIVPKTITEDMLGEIPDLTYMGESLEPEISVIVDDFVLANGEDYDIIYANNTEVGTATGTVAGKGNYTGRANFSFNIKPIDLTPAAAKTVAKMTFTGYQRKPAVTVTLNGTELVANTDYTVAYSNNTVVGTAFVKITGKGHYAGTASTSFEIVKASLAKATVATISKQIYSGLALKPTLGVKYGTLTLKSGIDYTAVYTDNVKVGTATVTLTGKGNFYGTKTATFTIAAYNLYSLDKSGLRGLTTAQADKKLAATTADEVSGTIYQIMKLKYKAVYTKTLQITWSKVSGATGYIVYGAPCGKPFRKLKTTTSLTYAQANLVAGKYYKYFVVAVKSGKIIATSKTIHVATKGGKVGNNGSIALNRTDLSIYRTKTYQLKPTVTKLTAGLTVSKHRVIKYETSNPLIASVTSTGIVTGKAKGICYIYAYTQDGLYARVKVTVK